MTNWDKISASAFSVYAINTNFDLYSWGQNYSNSPTTISCSTLGISENIKETIKIYPNPVKEIIHLSNITETDFEIYDILGNLVSKGNSENQINVNFLTKGVYILKLKNGENIINQKFIKE